MTKWVKRILICMAFMCMLCLTKQTAFAEEIEVNSTNFPDKAFRTYLLNNFDGTNDVYDDNKIDTDRISYLYLSNYNGEYKVKNLTGIELLKNLENISLSELPVKEYSFTSNKKVTSINISLYETKVAIDSVNIYNLPKLESFSIDSYWNKISKINVSKLPALKRATLTAIKADSVKITNVPKLEYLRIRNKNIKSFNVSNFTKLKTLDISCPISKLDISKLTKLESLSIGESQITSYDFTKLPKLKYITFGLNKKLSSVKLGSNGKLTSFGIYGSPKITSIDVSKCKNINNLYILDTSIKAIDVSMLSKLEYLDLADNKLSAINVAKNKELSDLRVSGNSKIDNINVDKNSKLSSINVGLTNVSKLDTSKNKALTSLYVYRTKISSLNLKNNKKLRTICYNNSKIKKLDLTKYKDLYIYYEGLKRGTTIDLSNFIGKNCKPLQKLEYGLKYNATTAKLKTPTSKKINYGWCQLGVGKGKNQKIYTININYK